MATTRWFFGFGSLVNERTLPADTTWCPATLRGWQRTWGHAIPRDPPWFALNVEPEANTSIDGLLIKETPSLAPQLAAREQGYSAHRLPDDAITTPLPAEDASIWIWRSDHPASPDQLGCLLQSYIDCVLKGFLTHFGEDGVERFLATTMGWHNPIIADRGAPRYPRAQALTTQIETAFDRQVVAVQHAARAAGGRDNV